MNYETVDVGSSVYVANVRLIHLYTCYLAVIGLLMSCYSLIPALNFGIFDESNEEKSLLVVYVDFRTCIGLGVVDSDSMDAGYPWYEGAVVC